jgi:hypothetical protein
MISLVMIYDMISLVMMYDIMFTFHMICIYDIVGI